jgi:hypothetical protein
VRVHAGTAGKVGFSEYRSTIRQTSGSGLHQSCLTGVAEMEDDEVASRGPGSAKNRKIAWAIAQSR